MSDATLTSIRELLAQCSPEEQRTLFREMRQRHLIHEFERVVGAPAEMILEALHRAPELTRRMLRGVIAEAAFRIFAVRVMETKGWKDVTAQGNFAYDFKIDNGQGPITVQVKLQRSEKSAPVVRSGNRYGFADEVFLVETQKTRAGLHGGEKTRPYRYGEFDVLAVSMQPSTGQWERYMYTLGRWLLPATDGALIATLQPVAKTPNDFWTDDFATAVAWFRARDGGKRMAMINIQKRAARKKRADG